MPTTLQTTQVVSSESLIYEKGAKKGERQGGGGISLSFMTFIGRRGFCRTLGKNCIQYKGELGMTSKSINPSLRGEFEYAKTLQSPFILWLNQDGTLTSFLTSFSFTSKSSSARQSRICFSNNTFTNQLICVHLHSDGLENEQGSAIFPFIQTLVSLRLRRFLVRARNLWLSSYPVFLVMFIPRVACFARSPRNHLKRARDLAIFKQPQ